MVAWLLSGDDEQKKPTSERPEDAVRVPLQSIARLGVQYWKLDPTSKNATQLRNIQHSVVLESTVSCKSMDSLNLSEVAVESFGCYVRSGVIILDMEDARDGDSPSWIRLRLPPGAVAVVPEGLKCRFSNANADDDKVDYALLCRSRYRERIGDAERTHLPALASAVQKRYRSKFLGGNRGRSTSGSKSPSRERSPSAPRKGSVNGQSFIVSGNAKALAPYPHVRQCGGMLYVSGTSSRRPNNTHIGAEKQDDGTFKLDIRLQTEAVLENIRLLLGQAGATLGHLVDLTVFLVDMKDFPGFNDIYKDYFEAETGPTRTTVAVHQLPHPNLLIEIKATACAP